ncbi:hypothetical protein ASPACDRAFT_58858 [Aspergillus aculeatus ATCC 16872]|uniref:Uncharacterized protein n=1 Tax=Aspergillus aculeatus (strain ATCC 16872 / CBS 172.66 / WB 5094) TaxID=690307 RepID=A0A1L9X228_ASPA1|nr:uncharacterized protein ASPACDRAFT_58858 [Aspergillus aculeatus ATCC 16872]OJK02557.1 hypothetical protein ASPACDRAFT_58858 [Aspergillus aculeatus ATCC 16872]
MSSPSNHEAAFHDLAQILSARYQNNEVLEIEILPPGLGPLLQDGTSVGVTKKYLAQAFVTARRNFFGALNGKSLDGPGHDNIPSQPGHWNSPSDELLLVSTEIILLFDCEHLTACNWRRRHLAASLQRHDFADYDNERLRSLIDALSKELSLTKTFLCSPLQRHTKSPTLWNYRSWLLTRLMRLQQRPLEQLDELSHEVILGILNDELAIVLRAGELHPRNYYAFTYLREVVGAASGIGDGGQDASTLLAESMIQKALQWCIAHPADISGWAFTEFLLERIPQYEIRSDAVRQVIQFALDIGWEGESLWIFVYSASINLDVDCLTEDGQWASQWDALPEHPLPRTRSKGGWKVWLDWARAVWTAGPAVN